MLIFTAINLAVLITLRIGGCTAGGKLFIPFQNAMLCKNKKKRATLKDDRLFIRLK